MEKNKILSLHSCCIPVKGARRSVICDVQRGNYYFIPTALYELLTTYCGHTILDLSNLFKDDFETILDYISFIEGHDLGRQINPEDADLFPSIDTSWLKPERITNAILEFRDDAPVLPLKDIAEELDILGCKGLQIRFYDKISTQKLIDILSYFNENRLRHIDIILKFSNDNSKEDLLHIINSFERVSFITVYKSPQDETINGDNEAGILYFEKKNLPSHLSCGITAKDYFSVNLETFTESHHHNSCLNRKISIDTEGDIKNCPSMSQSFGNIKDTTLQEALHHPDFKKYWNVTKDQIAVCQDCEFRYICTDCRAYTENPHDLYAKPLKCGYNPYTAEWDEWSTNPLKQKAIDFYGMRAVLPEFKLKADFVPGKHVGHSML